MSEKRDNEAAENSADHTLFESPWEAASADASQGEILLNEDLAADERKKQEEILKYQQKIAEHEMQIQNDTSPLIRDLHKAEVRHDLKKMNQEVEEIAEDAADEKN